MTTARIDCQGHLAIAPSALLERANAGPSQLVDDVLTRGTPAIFPSYQEYRHFVRKVAASLEVSPFSIFIRGSAQIGFSIAPNAGKLWMECGAHSDIDLAIVDPDHYHRLDVEIRQCERDRSPDDLGHMKNLGNNRRFYCYQHYDLPETRTCDEYKGKIAAIKQEQGREVTAFFYRDFWAFHDRYVYDIRELLERNELGLPTAPRQPRRARWLTDEDLGRQLWSGNQRELNLARTRKNRDTGITCDGLKRLEGLGPIRRLWLDNCHVRDDDIEALGTSPHLRFLSLAGTHVTDAALRRIVSQFPNLQALDLSAKRVGSRGHEAIGAFCKESLIEKLSIPYRWWSNRQSFVNANEGAVKLYHHR